jgi:hypothetical protein
LPLSNVVFSVVDKNGLLLTDTIYEPALTSIDDDTPLKAMLDTTVLVPKFRLAELALGAAFTKRILALPDAGVFKSSVTATKPRLLLCPTKK